MQFTQKQWNLFVFFIIILGVIIYYGSMFIEQHPYWSGFIGFLFVCGLVALIYFTIKKQEFRDAEKNFFSSMFEKIRDALAERRERKKARVPIPQNIKEKVLQRAGYQCQRCTEMNNLNIHHIDGNPSNNSINNLIVLCPTHHANADKGTISKDQLKALMHKQTRSGKTIYV